MLPKKILVYKKQILKFKVWIFTFSNDSREDAEPASGSPFLWVCGAGQKKIWLCVSHQAPVLSGDQFVDKDITG